VLFISNAFVPLDAMPAWMAAIARVNPLSYAITSLRILVLDGWTAELPVTLAVLAASAAALLAFGTWEFRRHTGGRVG
jgi:ABC-2 type transport system permease protein